MSYVVIGAVAPAVAGSYLVLVLVACGLLEIAVEGWESKSSSGLARAMSPAVIGHVGGRRRPRALAWVALKVGALSYGGGFVIVPLMQHDVVSTITG